MVADTILLKNEHHEMKNKYPHVVVVGNIKNRRHHKPYLLSHLGLLVVAGWLFFSSVLLLGLRIFSAPPSSEVLASSTTSGTNAHLQQVTSDQGLSLQFDPSAVELKAFTEDVSGNLREVQADELAAAKVLKLIKVKPNQETAISLEAASQLSIEFGGTSRQLSNKSVLTQAEVKESATEHLGGISMEKVVYKHTTRIGSADYHSYSVEWSGMVSQEKVIILIEGLQGASLLPSVYDTVLNSLSLSSAHKVLGAQTSLSPFQTAFAKTNLAQSYITDAVSPAVVKIYQITCGILVIDGRDIGNDTCDVSAGSGFFVSSDGHIATSGHVVQYDAEDALIHALLQDPDSLLSFLKYIGLTDAQIMSIGEKPELLAAIIAKIYDSPADLIKFKNMRNSLIVALGSRPLRLTSQQDAKEAITMRDTDYLKQARRLAVNYSAKDLFVIIADQEEGFSSSDVALIKVSASNTPHIDLFDNQVTQNQKITIIGFPGDADNKLTDNNSLNTTITNGSISAIRVAAGSSYRLYQSDADASKGSSGGPVITEDGLALGLLTYRFKNERAVDAAKSYIRDINDLKTLAAGQGVTLGAVSSTQENWLEGLKLFSENRFSKALQEFEEVKTAYPAHRLVSSYEVAAENAIAAGRDVKEAPLSLIIMSSFIGAAGASAAVILVARHHNYHRAYQFASMTRVLGPGTNHHHTPTHYAHT